MRNHTLTTATVVDGNYAHHAHLSREQRICTQVPHMITVVGPHSADTASVCLVDRKLHGLVRQSMAKTPVTIEERGRRCLTLARESCTRDDQTLRQGVYVPGDLHDAVGIMPR